jgi:hypothetical protein
MATSNVIATSHHSPVEVKKIEHAQSEQLEEVKPVQSAGAGHVEGNALLIDRNGNVRHLPIPSDSPNDPLNFKRWEKAAIVFCCCWFCEFFLVSGVSRPLRDSLLT